MMKTNLRVLVGATGMRAVVVCRFLVETLNNQGICWDYALNTSAVVDGHSTLGGWV